MKEQVVILEEQSDGAIQPWASLRIAWLWIVSLRSQ